MAASTKRTLIACAVVFILCVISFEIYNSGILGGILNYTTPQTRVSSSAVTRESLVEKCRVSTEKNFPGHNLIEYDPDADQLTIAVWIDDMDEAAVSAMIGTTGTRDAWNDMVCGVEDACAAWQTTFDSAGFSDVTVVMHLLNPSNLDNALISTARGQLIYDVVGGYVRQQSLPMQTQTTTFVINTDTHVFHLPTCSAVDRILPENFDYYVGSRQGVIANGYRPCGICNP